MTRESFAAILNSLFLTFFHVWYSVRFYTFWINWMGTSPVVKYMKNVMESILFRQIAFFSFSLFLRFQQFSFTECNFSFRTTYYIECMRAIHLLRSFVMVIAVWCVFAEVCVLYNHCHCHHHTFHQSNMRFRNGSRNTLALIWPLDKRADFISIYHFGFRILQLMSSSTSLCNICRSICRDMHEAKRE